MLIAKVTGNIVATLKHKDYMAQKLLIVREVDLEGNICGPEMVALDGADADAGVGEYVLVNQEGGGARMAARIDHIGPVEATVVAVIDCIETYEGGFIQSSSSMEEFQ